AFAPVSKMRMATPLLMQAGN
nr:Chain G, CLIP peptide [Homo sapiens]7YXB_H Chain H, CLIP peptide [Homo sapiens]